MKGKAITITDLASRLGISAATVSRALKDHPDISQATKIKVKALAQELNYRPNSIAQGLRQSHSGVIGVIVPDLVHHFFSSVISGIMKEAYSNGYKVMLCQSGESYEKEVTDARALLESRVDGLMMSLANETSEYPHLQEFVAAGLPIVFFDKVPEDWHNHSRVVVDDYKGAFEVVTHLAEQGYSQIAHFGGPQIPKTSRERLRGYKDALEASNLPFRKELLYYCSKVTRQEGHNFARELMARHPETQAIFAVADQVAIGAMVALKEAGVDIPGQVGVAGFSDWEIASVIEPRLTTVYQPGEQMGKTAAALLLNEIKILQDDEVAVQHHLEVLPTRLIVRESTLKKG